MEHPVNKTPWIVGLVALDPDDRDPQRTEDLLDQPELRTEVRRGLGPTRLVVGVHLEPDRGAPGVEGNAEVRTAAEIPGGDEQTIGEHFGGRDHTTVIHSCQTVKDLMDTDGVFRDNVMELQQKVQLAAM